MSILAYFIGGPADGQVREFDSRPPDNVEILNPQLHLGLAKPKPAGEVRAYKPIETTIYSRSDLTGGTVIYVPAGTLLHDAFLAILESYVEAKKEAVR